MAFLGAGLAKIMRGNKRMRILVYGAGVLGCNLAHDIYRAKKDVTILARSVWASRIQQDFPLYHMRTMNM